MSTLSDKKYPEILIKYSLHLLWNSKFSHWKYLTLFASQLCAMRLTVPLLSHITFTSHCPTWKIQLCSKVLLSSYYKSHLPASFITLFRVFRPFRLTILEKTSVDLEVYMIFVIFGCATWFYLRHTLLSMNLIRSHLFISQSSKYSHFKLVYCWTHKWWT